MRDSYASTAFAEVIDRSVHAATARFTAGLSPMALVGAYMDWAAHLAFSPGKQLRLGEKAVKKSLRLANYASRRALGTDGAEPCIVPLPQDQRFDDPAWRTPPYDLIYQSFLLDAAVVAQRDDRRARRDARRTRTWSRSRRARCSTCSRRRTRRSPIPKCWSARAPKAA